MRNTVSPAAAMFFTLVPFLASCAPAPSVPSNDEEPPHTMNDEEPQHTVNDEGPVVAARPDATPRVPLEGEQIVSAAADSLPDDLTCVSAPLTPFGSSDVLRVSLWRTEESGGVFSSWTQRGPQFWAHEGTWFGADGETLPAAVERELVVATNGSLVGEDGAGTLTMSLARDGHVLRGILIDDECSRGEEVAVTCWSYQELYGSPWTGVVGTLPARFDWTTSSCVDVNGVATAELNVLPIEVVRETRTGECGDLRGARLNGDDFNVPQLDGWFLAGAKLDGAQLFFANLSSATLEGADLSEVSFAYASISGSFDYATELPVGTMPCEVHESPWAGSSVTCQN